MIRKEIEAPREISPSLAQVHDRMMEIAEPFLNELTRDPVTHFLKIPGKLIRPALALTSAMIIGKEPNRYIDIAAAIEFLHIASLVHDDIIDKDEKRRGIETVHKKYGIDNAVLVGDMLFALAVNTASKYGSEVIYVTSKAAADMCNGEFLDSNAQKQKNKLNLDEYLKIANLKTASLISSATSIIAIYEKDKRADMLSEFGKNIGMSFQIRDDILNYLKKDKLKDSSSDLENFRPNIISACEGIYKNPIEEAIKRNNQYIERAKNSLKELGNSGSYLLPYVEFLKIEE